MWGVYYEGRGGDGARIERLLSVGSNWEDIDPAG